MVAFLVSVVRAEVPVGIEGVLKSCGGMESVRSLVIRVDKSRRARAQTVHRLEGCDPAVLGEVVVEEAKSGTEDGFAAVAGSIGEAEPRPELLVVIARDCGGESEGRQKRKRRIRKLASTGGDEESEGGLIAQAVVEGKVAREPPGILGIQSQALNILGETATQSIRGCTALHVGRKN